jgi:hypothetical protein
LISERARAGQLLRWGWIPLLLTTFLRAAWLWRFPANPLDPVDAEGFHLLARNLLDGHGFAIGWDAPFCPTAIRTPLYPLFVAAVYVMLGRAPYVVVLCQILLETLTTGLTVALARSTVRRPGAWALLPGVLYALNGTTQRFTGYLLSESLLLPLLATAVHLTVLLLRRPRRTRAAAAGLLWGLVLLTKPNLQYLVLAVLGLVMTRLLVFHRETYSRVQGQATSAILCGVLLAVVAPWVIRNQLRFDRWLLSTAFEENLARVSVVAVQAELAGIEAEPWTPTWEHVYQQFVMGVDPAAAAILVPRPDTSCTLLDDYHRQVAHAARDSVAENAVLYTRIHLRGVARSLLDPGHRLWYRVWTGRDWAETGVLPLLGPRLRWALERGAWGDALSAFRQERVARIPLGAGLLWWALWAGRVAVGWAALRGVVRLRSRGFVMLLFLGVVVYHLVLPGPIAHDRFYAPVVPLVTVLVAWGAGGYNRSLGLPTHSLGGWGGHDD